eukprot:4446001-Karenia_brevis.AAC.1
MKAGGWEKSPRERAGCPLSRGGQHHLVNHQLAQPDGSTYLTVYAHRTAWSDRISEGEDSS